ncbi:mpv17-like protein 2 [Hyalella azteca]|uniref:Mpv17-like protein 2 n=1 Tax=Hyalella azteca TaxID=294128 RepID=A0A8B7PLB1_HYAAZ|nr:mpv17-like protein 2 [Hyalella azteca]XP_018026776.1 mpv17-like protein 2 [Hyalella azteca]XP_018026777.1 mpv17-like protein 2 [Hyalella azteca]XP_018026778.1 mpv17-like protein 2 [Hyalella azteca]XP_018026779.1 mpv17-like protein 2 [Hyalella azteca]
MGKLKSLQLFLPTIENVVKLRSVLQTKTYINNAFTKYLLVTNVSISMALSGCGDLLQQHYKLSSKPAVVAAGVHPYDVVRTVNMTASGASVGMLCHYWYQFLDRALPGRSLRVIMKKLAVDQILFSPVCLCVFFGSLAVSRKCIAAFTDHVTENSAKVSSQKDTSHSISSQLSNFTEDLRHKGALMYVSEWIVWPPAQLVNFYFLPTRFRVLYDNTISLIYDVFASHIYNDMAIEDVQLLASRASSLITGTDNSSDEKLLNNENSSDKKLDSSLSSLANSHSLMSHKNR